MATTTFAAIRDRQVATIRALTPTIRAQDRFVYARGERPLRDWARENKNAAFRQFTITNGLQYSTPEIANHDLIWQRMRETVEIAYPRTLVGKYGPDNERDMTDFIDADWRQIDQAIGDYAYNTSFVDGQSVCTLRDGAPVVELDGEVAFLVLDYEVGFWRAV